MLSIYSIVQEQVAVGSLEGASVSDFLTGLYSLGTGRELKPGPWSGQRHRSRSRVHVNAAFRLMKGVLLLTERDYKTIHSHLQ